MTRFELTESGKIPSGSVFRKCWNFTFHSCRCWIAVTKNHVMVSGLQWPSIVNTLTLSHLKLPELMHLSSWFS